MCEGEITDTTVIHIFIVVAIGAHMYVSLSAVLPHTKAAYMPLLLQGRATHMFIILIHVILTAAQLTPVLSRITEYTCVGVQDF